MIEEILLKDIDKKELDKARKDLAIYNALKRLRDNEDYQLVIMDSLISEQSSTMFEMLLLPKNLAYLSREEILEQIEAIKLVKTYLGDSNADGILDINGKKAMEIIHSLED